MAPAKLNVSLSTVRTLVAVLVALSLMLAVPNDEVGATSVIVIVATAFSASSSSLLFNVIVPLPVE